MFIYNSHSIFRQGIKSFEIGDDHIFQGKPYISFNTDLLSIGILM